MSGSVSPALTVLTPSALNFGAVLVLTGSTTSPSLAALDYTLDAGATWIPLTGLIIGGGSWRGQGPVINAIGTIIASVRDHDNPAVTATTGSIPIAPVQGETRSLTIDDPVGAIQGTPIPLSGTFVSGPPLALDYSTTGTIWAPLSNFKAIGGLWTATGPAPVAGGSLTLQVRDRNALAVQASTDQFTVTALSSTPGPVLSLAASNARYRATSVHAFFATDPDLASSSATFETRLAQHIAACGDTPAFMNVSVDTWADPSQWNTSNNYLALSWSLSSASKLVPILSIPLCASKETSRLPVFEAFASGVYDPMLRTLIASWRDYGFPNLYVRLAWDANLLSTPWHEGSTISEIAAWIAAFQHVSDVVRGVPGASVKVIFSPAISAGDGVQFEHKYPGDEAVDLIGLDLSSSLSPVDYYSWSRNNGSYDPDLATWSADPVNRMHYWDWPSATQLFPTGVSGDGSVGLGYLTYFASAHSKNICIPQSGVGGSVTGGSPNAGFSLWDDPAFPQHLAQALFAPGAPACDFISAWDCVQPTVDWTFSDPTYTGSIAKPLTIAAWANLFQTRGGAAGSFDLLWTAPYASQGPFTYVVQQRLAGASQWSQMGPPTAQTNITVTALAAGSSYDFRVAAVNGQGQGPWSTITAQQVPTS